MGINDGDGNFAVSLFVAVLLYLSVERCVLSVLYHPAPDVTVQKGCSMCKEGGRKLTIALL